LIDPKNKEFVLDFLPDKVGYQGKPNLKFNAILRENGNEYLAIYETDSYFLLLDSRTS
jgi:hypothetical protein